MAHGNSLLLSLELHHFISKELNHVHMVGLQFLHIVVLEALMLCEFASSKFLHAHLALDHDLWAESFDVVSKLTSCHVLELAKEANIAAILLTLVILSVLLELSH